MTETDQNGTIHTNSTNTTTQNDNNETLPIPLAPTSSSSSSSSRKPEVPLATSRSQSQKFSREWNTQIIEKIQNSSGSLADISKAWKTEQRKQFTSKEKTKKDLLLFVDNLMQHRLANVRDLIQQRPTQE